jgi:methyltransferase (TIGR00027 family)
MNETSISVRRISDTALWVACFRAKETERPDALFHDPFARKLAGERGFEIAQRLQDGTKHEWAWMARTFLFDQFIAREVAAGADVVLNLAAGLDARPYRMDLPSSLHWIEVDLPEIVSYKNEVLAADTPRCAFERIALDLSDVAARQALFARVNGLGTKVVVMTEGLLIYFTNDEVAAFAQDLAAPPNFRRWVFDLTSPGQLRVMQRTTGKQLSEAGAAFKFGPPEGANFFKPHGWELLEIQGMLQTAASLNRAPAELLSLLPEPKGLPGNYPWTGVGVLTRAR